MEEKLIKNRYIRVFVSSTFRDMQAERDVLVKRIFPQLRRLCDKRGVSWGEVDLRWGITEEQAAEGKVLPICLDEIKRCRPYFIGLLGERYGWVPDSISHELIDQEPWLAEHLNCSITELEILHGVLNNPEMADHAYFYFRDPAYIDTLPIEVQADFREGPTDEEIRRLTENEAEKRARERQKKLAGLKRRILNSNLLVRENYRDPHELGNLILRDITEVINHHFPEGSEPDRFERELAEHEKFADSLSKVYIGRQDYFDNLDSFACSDGPPLVVLGESGLGKSSLLANWAIRYRKSNPECFLLIHFIGATPTSTNWMAMLQRILVEFQKWFGIEGDIPDKPDAIRSTFAQWLHIADSKGRMVLILDALNQLEDREGALDLVWLPNHFPDNVRIILSTLPGRSLSAIEERGWLKFEVEPLTLEERKKLIEEYLAQYSKSLSSARVGRIIYHPQTSNPLFLRALLEELRIFGIYEQLEPYIDNYLTAKTIDELYEYILDRYEGDYEVEIPGLVGKSMGLIWAARGGLSEFELLELLGSSNQPLPHAYWSPLYLASEQSLLERNGLITFYHDYFRQAVENRYITPKEKSKGFHLQIADYFEKHETNERVISELPWQLLKSMSWHRLYKYLTDPDLFNATWLMNEFDVKAYWTQLENESSHNMTDAYRDILQASRINPDYVWHVATLLYDLGHTIETLRLRRYLVDYYRNTGSIGSLSGALTNLAEVVTELGELDGAMSLYTEQEQVCRTVGDDYGLQASLGNQGVIVLQKGDINRALSLFREQEEICRESGYKLWLARSLGNQGVITREKGKLDEAMALHKDEERIYRELGDKTGLLHSLEYQAEIHQRLGDIEKSIALLEISEKMCMELGDKRRLANVYGATARLLVSCGIYSDEIMELFKKQENIYRELNSIEALAISLANQAVFLRDIGDPDEALDLAENAHQLAVESGNYNIAHQIELILDSI